jgi:flagellar biosynthesis protein FlhF
MPHETLTGTNISDLLSRAQEHLGPDAVLLAVRRIQGPEETLYEVLAADPATARAEARRTARALAREESRIRPLDGEPDPLEPEKGPAMPRRPRVVALVGPTGSGKTTTIAKLANHWAAYGDRAVGLLCLDTYRIGGIEQAQIYADLSRLPLEVVFEESQIPRALHRLRDREVILVDTPGRGPRSEADAEAMRSQLALLAPDEVHLTLSAGLQERVARRVIAEHRLYGVTHLLPTKLDEDPDDMTPFELARQNHLLVRWVADGQEVPADLRAAPSQARRERMGREPLAAAVA